MIGMVEIMHRLRLLLTVAAACLLWSCADGRDEVPSEPDGAEGAKSYVAGISASIATRVGEDGGDGGDESGGSGSSDDVGSLIPYQLAFDGNTILQVSQQAPNIYPFLTPEATYDFKYKTDYVEHEGAWDDEDSYNFAPHENDEPLEWNKIASLGSVGNGFAMYCMYFPDENRLRNKVNDAGAVNYYVMEDQSTLENLKKSDILGAYHSTPEIFTRIRFRLFHLMTYFRIRLYVPVYDDTKNTGYRDGSLLYATLDNVTPDFAIDWNVNINSDTAGPFVSPLSGDGTIKMYQHPLPDNQTEYPITKIMYSRYLPEGFYDQGIEGDYDDVRVYDFSVIIPKQKGVEVDGKETNFTDTKFLNFYLRTNSGGTTRYYFSQSFSSGLNEDMTPSDQGVFKMDQGVLLYIQLYVPRVGNQVVFMGATVNPWNQMQTDMVLKPTEPGGAAD